MKNLTRQEELVLLAILNLKTDAYLISILDYLSEVTRKKISMTSIHLPLSRLEKAGLIKGEFGESTAIRGGRRKKIYSLTKPGQAALDEYRRVNDVLWKSYKPAN